MKATTIKELKAGELFTLKPCEEPNEKIVWVRGEYDRSTKKYSCYKWADTNHENFYRGSIIVYTEFYF